MYTGKELVRLVRGGERESGERPGLWLAKQWVGHSYKVTTALVDGWEGWDLEGRDRRNVSPLELKCL